MVELMVSDFPVQKKGYVLAIAAVGRCGHVAEYVCIFRAIAAKLG